MKMHEELTNMLAAWDGSFQAFVRQLNKQGTPYLSFSKITSVEFCPQRYLLEYVERKRLVPEPAYFRKGRLFHELAARIYRANRRRREPDVENLHALLARKAEGEDHNHLSNALELILENVFAGWEVVAVEEPFVLDLSEELPVCLGVVDLVLRRDDQFAVIDHKSGKNFGKPDPLQLVLYKQHVGRHFDARQCQAFFDEYRWVNNLKRIRKPAFQRTEIRVRANAWTSTLKRIDRAYRKILKIEQTGQANGGGPCYMCPFKEICPKASVSYDSWY